MELPLSRFCSDQSQTTLLNCLNPQKIANKKANLFNGYGFSFDSIKLTTPLSLIRCSTGLQPRPKPKTTQLLHKEVQRHHPQPHIRKSATPTLCREIEKLVRFRRYEEALELLRILGLSLTRVAGTIHYMDPDMLMTGRSTYKSDVYSFGVMLFEIFGRQRVYSEDVNFVQVCWTKFENGQIEDFLDERGFAEYYKANAIILLMVAFWCVQFTPAARPPMRAVVQMLEKEREVPSPPDPFNPASATWS